MKVERLIFYKLKLRHVMKKKVIRNDLMSKMQYSKAYNINRVRINQMIKDGELSVEVIGNVEYIKLQTK